MDRTTHRDGAGVDRAGQRRLLTAGVIGSSLEWYDFFIYATAAALVFGDVFFPESSAVTGTLLSFSTFWAGFVARPIGGIVAGHLGDRFGRKPALVSCLLLMGIATFAIGLLPGAATIGVAAPILLVVLRFLQGIAVGGQWGGIALLLTESAEPRRRGFAGTFAQMGVPAGVILGNGAFLLIGALVDDAAFASWGWRIPFLLSALLFPVVLYVQTRIEESPAFDQLRAEAAERHQGVGRAPLSEAVRSHWRTILLGAGLFFATNATFYIAIAGMLDYGTRILGLARTSLLGVVLLVSLLGIGIILASGAWSDRVGRRRPIVIGAVLLIVWAFPFFWLIDTASLGLIFVALAIGTVGQCLTYGPSAAFLGELFAPRVRYSAISLAYQLAAILISGGTPFLMVLLLEATGTSASVSAYIAITGLLTLGAALALPETAPAKTGARPARDTSTTSS